MFGISNPYQGAVQALEDAISACYTAAGALEDIPPHKGKREIEHPTYAAKHLLDEALACARQWQGSFDHHLHGGAGHVRSDF